MIQNKVVIITGASSGIGEATAKLLASKSAKVVLGARREEQLKQLTDKIQQAGGQAVYQVLDVTNPADNAKIVELAKATFGGVDVIFLNAAKALAALGLTGVLGRNINAQETALWNDATELAINFEVFAPSSGRYKRPYIAVWIEDASGFPVRTLALWVQTGKGSR
jgi:NAD(P)-dependent dehydrogenase (short-subunit alcohol dehydrogenase family)